MLAPWTLLSGLLHYSIDYEKWKKFGDDVDLSVYLHDFDVVKLCFAISFAEKLTTLLQKLLFAAPQDALSNGVVK